ncbi:MAG: hypothetical protein ACK52I_19200 [Pseudomonadota bacterium]|jgi:hypothetical protein
MTPREQYEALFRVMAELDLAYDGVHSLLKDHPARIAYDNASELLTELKCVIGAQREAA